MNREFKTQFHAGLPDEKPIVTMSVSVNNGKKFKALDNYNKRCLIQNLETFKKQIDLLAK